MDDNQGRGPVTPHGWQPPHDMNHDYKRAYQIVLKKVEELEAENERLREAMVALKELSYDYVGLELWEQRYGPIHPQSE